MSFFDKVSFEGVGKTDEYDKNLQYIGSITFIRTVMSQKYPDAKITFHRFEGGGWKGITGDNGANCFIVENRGNILVRASGVEKWKVSLTCPNGKQVTFCWDYTPSCCGHMFFYAFTHSSDFSQGENDQILYDLVMCLLLVSTSTHFVHANLVSDRYGNTPSYPAIHKLFRQNSFKHQVISYSNPNTGNQIDMVVAEFPTSQYKYQ